MSDHEQTLEEYWKKRAEKAEARVKELETLLDVFCGLQIPELRAEVERLREVVDLCAIWFEVDDEERKSMGGDDRMREALAAREGQEEAKDT